jgi:hypothetical protein
MRAGSSHGPRDRIRGQRQSGQERRRTVAAEPRRSIITPAATIPPNAVFIIASRCRAARFTLHLFAYALINALSTDRFRTVEIVRSKTRERRAES